MEKILWTLHILSMRHGVIYPVTATIKRVAFFSAINPREINDTSLHDQKVGVWPAISRKSIINPMFFDEAINSEHYREVFLCPFVDK
jgi:hypothetical protein